MKAKGGWIFGVGFDKVRVQPLSPSLSPYDAAIADQISQPKVKSLHTLRKERVLNDFKEGGQSSE